MLYICGVRPIFKKKGKKSHVTCYSFERYFTIGGNCEALGECRYCPVLTAALYVTTGAYDHDRNNRNYEKKIDDMDRISLEKIGLLAVIGKMDSLMGTASEMGRPC